VLNYVNSVRIDRDLNGGLFFTDQPTRLANGNVNFHGALDAPFSEPIFRMDPTSFGVYD
jgi:hypothetical protein